MAALSSRAHMASSDQPCGSARQGDVGRSPARCRPGGQPAGSVCATQPSERGLSGTAPGGRAGRDVGALLVLGRKGWCCRTAQPQPRNRLVVGGAGLEGPEQRRRQEARRSRCGRWTAGAAMSRLSGRVGAVIAAVARQSFQQRNAPPRGVPSRCSAAHRAGLLLGPHDHVPLFLRKPLAHGRGGLAQGGQVVADAGGLLAVGQGADQRTFEDAAALRCRRHGGQDQPVVPGHLGQPVQQRGR